MEKLIETTYDMFVNCYQLTFVAYKNSSYDKHLCYYQPLIKLFIQIYPISLKVGVYHVNRCLDWIFVLTLWLVMK